MPSPEHPRSRVATTLLVAAGHAYLCLVGALGLLNYTVPSKYPGIEIIASDQLWTWIHGTCAILIAGSVFLHPIRMRRIDLPPQSLACSIGFGFMLIWAFTNLMWGLTVIRPVSLATPGLAFVVAAGEQLLANAWNRGALTEDR